jgi:hypothetical protein
VHENESRGREQRCCNLERGRLIPFQLARSSSTIVCLSELRSIETGGTDTKAVLSRVVPASTWAGTVTGQIEVYWLYAIGYNNIEVTVHRKRRISSPPPQLPYARHMPPC